MARTVLVVAGGFGLLWLLVQQTQAEAHPNPLPPRLRTALRQTGADGRPNPVLRALGLAIGAVGPARLLAAYGTKAVGALRAVLASGNEPLATDIAGRIIFQRPVRWLPNVEAAGSGMPLPPLPPGTSQAIDVLLEGGTDAHAAFAAGADILPETGVPLAGPGAAAAFVEAGSVQAGMSFVPSTAAEVIGVPGAVTVVPTEVTFLPQFATEGLTAFSTAFAIPLAAMTVLELAGVKTLFSHYRTDYELFAGRLSKTITGEEQAIKALTQEIAVSRSRGDLKLSVQNFAQRLADATGGGLYVLFPYLVSGQGWAPFEANPAGTIGGYLPTPPGATGTTHEGGLVRNYDPIMASIRTGFLAMWRRLIHAGPSGAVYDLTNTRQRLIDAGLSPVQADKVLAGVYPGDVSADRLGQIAASLGWATPPGRAIKAVIGLAPSGLVGLAPNPFVLARQDPVSYGGLPALVYALRDTGLLSLDEATIIVQGGVPTTITPDRMTQLMNYGATVGFASPIGQTMLSLKAGWDALYGPPPTPRDGG